MVERMDSSSALGINNLNMDDKLTCPVCQEIFKDAIETACGHVSTSAVSCYVEC